MASLKMQNLRNTFHSSFNIRKFKEKKIEISSFLEVVPLNSKIKLGHFEIDFITLTHSISSQMV